MLMTRKAMLLLIAAVVLITNSAAANPKVGENLLKNSHFTDQLTSWKVYEHANRFDAKVTPVEAKWLPHGGPDQSGSLYIHPKYPPEDKFGYFVQVSQCVPIGDAVEFEVGANFKYEGIPKNNYSNRINIHWYKSPDCKSEGQHGPLVPSKRVTGWQRISEKKIKPMLQARSAVVELFINVRTSINSKDPSKITKAHWDDIYFKATRLSKKEKTKKSINAKHTLPFNQNHIVNGGFDNDLSTWEKGLWWLEWTGSEGDSKPGALKVKSTSSKRRIAPTFKKCINFGTHQRFNAGVSIKRGSASARESFSTFLVTWYELEDCKGRYKQGKWVNADTSKTGWQRLSMGPMRAPEGTVSARIEGSHMINGAGDHLIFWDDVYFKAIP